MHGSKRKTRAVAPKPRQAAEVLNPRGSIGKQLKANGNDKAVSKNVAKVASKNDEVDSKNVAKADSKNVVKVEPNNVAKVDANNVAKKRMLPSQPKHPSPPPPRPQWREAR